MSTRDKKLLYHLTRVENLAGIKAMGLVSRRTLLEAESSFVDVADAEILEGRESLGLDRMVPFHFLSRNPFDYGVVRQYPKDRFVLLTVQRAVARSGDWKILPRHPLSSGEPIEALPWDDGLEAIAWNKIDQEDRDWENDRECKSACMAEALSQTTVPLAKCFRIYAPSDDTATEARAALGKWYLCDIEVNPHMFPKGCR